MLRRFFPPSCPIDPFAKTWIEGRLQYLRGLFGDERFLRRPLIAVTKDQFPELYLPKGTNLQALFERVCTLMCVDPARVDLQVLPALQPLQLQNQSEKWVSMAAGTYERRPGRRSVVRVDAGDASAFPGHQIVTFAHELAHLRLHEDVNHGHFEIDSELLTDLAVLHHGFGVMQSGSPRAWESQLTLWPDSTRPMPKYMSSVMFGWALATQAYLREETRPAWFAGIHHDARSIATRGLDYLHRTGDTPFRTHDWSEWEAMVPKLSKIYRARFTPSASPDSPGSECAEATDR